MGGGVGLKPPPHNFGSSLKFVYTKSIQIIICDRGSEQNEFVGVAKPEPGHHEVHAVDHVKPHGGQSLVHAKTAI